MLLRSGEAMHRIGKIDDFCAGIDLRDSIIAVSSSTGQPLFMADDGNSGTEVWTSDIFP